MLVGSSAPGTNQFLDLRHNIISLELSKDKILNLKVKVLVSFSNWKNSQIGFTFQKSARRNTGIELQLSNNAFFSLIMP